MRELEILGHFEGILGTGVGTLTAVDTTVEANYSLKYLFGFRYPEDLDSDGRAVANADLATDAFRLIEFKFSSESVEYLSFLKGILYGCRFFECRSKNQ
jgi:hypothetical protein